MNRMNQTPQEKVFTTSDTFLAAYLQLKEVKLHGLEIVDGHGVFVFDEPQDGMLHEWHAALYIGNVRQYALAYKALIKMIKDRRREEESR